MHTHFYERQDGPVAHILGFHENALALPAFPMNLNLLHPEKKRIKTEQTDQHMNDNAPFTNPKWVLVIEGKKNIT